MDSHQPYMWKFLWNDVSEDISSYLNYADEYNKGSHSFFRKLSAFFTPSVFACFLYRLSHYVWCKSFRRIAMLIARLNLFIVGLNITPSSRIGGGLYIAHPSSCVIFQGHAGKNLSMFAASVVLADHYFPLNRFDFEQRPQLGDNVSLGAKSIVTGDIFIGNNVKIGMNTYLNRDVSSGSIVLSRHVRNKVIEKTNS